MLAKARNLRLLLITSLCLLPGQSQLQAQTKVKKTQAMQSKSNMVLAQNNRSHSVTSNKQVLKKKTSRRKVPYSYLLPFGMGQFQEGKNLLGTTLAAGQAGFLLMYFDRLEQIRGANRDVAEVMRGTDPVRVRQDPAIAAYLNTNEQYVIQAQKQAQLALLGFFTLYTAGVAEAVFDPWTSLREQGARSSRKFSSQSIEKDSELSLAEDMASDPRPELKPQQKNSPKVGFYWDPSPEQNSFGLSWQSTF